VSKLSCIACAVSMALAGCSLAPTYSVPQVGVPAAFKESTNDVWQPAAPADTVRRGQWWALYGNEDLNSLEQRIDSANPTLAAALSRYTQARALAAEAHASLFPTINAGALATRDRQSDNRPLRSASQPANYDDQLIGASTSYEIDLWGRARNEAEAGNANVQALAADTESINLSLHAELANEYVELCGIDAEIKLLRDTVTAYHRALQLTETRHEGGIASGLDVSRAQTQLDTTQAQLTDRRSRRALLEHAIASLVGTPASQFSLTSADFSFNMPTIPVGIPSSLLERRPDIATAERRAAAANAEIGVARAAYFPRLNLLANGGFEDDATGAWLAAPNRYWLIGPQAVFTLFDAGRRSAEVTRARALFDETANRYRATVLNAFQEVEDQLALLNLLSQEMAEQNDATVAAERTVDLALNRYREGAVNYLEVVVAQTAALQAERTILNLRTQRLQASVRLIRALGGGWSTQDLPTQLAARDFKQPK